jgi:arylsulfatase A-like enzyme
VHHFEIGIRGKNQMTPQASNLRLFLLVGSWLGLAYGFAEAIEFSLFGLVPGGLSWRNGNSARVLWVAPIVYVVVVTTLSLLFYGMGRLIRNVDWLKLFVFAILAGGCYLGVSLQGQIFSRVASLLLALGIATQLTRLFVKRREQLLRLMRRTLLPLAAAVVVIAIAELSITAIMERRALAMLPSAGAHPNVLILLADTLRADHVSTYGYKRPTTPRIDHFAAEGRTYLEAYSTSCWTLPAHASLLTGRRVHEHRAGHPFRPYLGTKFPTLAEVLGRSGYASGGFIANTFWVGRQTGLQRGFIRYEDFYGNVGDALVRTSLGRTLAYEVLPYFGFIDISGRKTAGDVNDRLLGWIDSLGGRPFFALANYMDVHGPYIPPAAYRGRFASMRLDRRPTEIELGAIDATTKVPDPAVLRSWIDGYDESLLYLDEQVGRLLDELARRGILDRTIIVFTSDHGESWGEHNLIYHGHSLYQEQIRIPFIIRFPSGVAAGERTSRPVALEQIPLLVAELAGITQTPFPAYPLNAEAAPQREAIAVSEVSQRRGVPSAWPTASGGLRSVQTEQWHLIVSETGTAELYDIVNDRAESKNLAGEPRFADVLSRLQRRLAMEVPMPASGTRWDGPSGK